MSRRRMHRFWRQLHTERSYVPRTRMLARIVVLLALLLTAVSVAWVVALRRMRSAERCLARARSELHDVRRLAVIGRSAAAMTHDLSNLLIPIIACSELLMAQCEREQQQRNLRAIHQAALRARELTRGLLLDKPREPIRQTVHPTRMLLSLRSFLAQFVGSDIDIAFHAQADMPAMLADPAQIERVIINLVVNAAEALDRVWSDDRRITVSLDSEFIDAARPHVINVAHGCYVRITVQDNGPGIRDEVRTKLFDPFCSTKGPEAGVGFGLCSVRDIVEQHSGGIVVYSLPQRGTRFDVYLPAMAPAQAASPRSHDDTSRRVSHGRSMA